jgi:hypothetical protein
VSRWLVTIGLVAIAAVPVIAVVSARDGGGSADAIATPDPAELPASAAEAEAARADAARAAVSRALQRDAACARASCKTPAALAQRAARVSTVVQRLDDVYARTRTGAAKLQRVATSAFLHAALELQSCFQLSREKHGGEVEMSECHGPLAQYGARTRDLNAAVHATP